MKNFYRRLSMKGPSTESAIRQQIDSAQLDEVTRTEARHVLLCESRRTVYDQHWYALTSIAELRVNLGLHRTAMWLQDRGAEFDPPAPTSSPLADSSIIIPASADKGWREAASVFFGPSRNATGGRGEQNSREARDRWFPNIPLSRRATVCILCYWGFLVILLGWYFLASWPNFQVAVFQNTEAAYENFISRFPESPHAVDCRNRLRSMRDDAAWNQAAIANNSQHYRDYLGKFSPDGKYVNLARSRLTVLANAQYQKVSGSRQDDVLLKFLREYPESTFRDQVERRIEELRGDFEWVREKDTISAYRIYLQKQPSSPSRAWVEKRIIDLEVDAIANGEYGVLPKAKAIARGNSVHAFVAIENSTIFVLTVRFSGIESAKLVIPPGATEGVLLRSGTYRVAASVNAANVTNYYGMDNYESYHYQVTFYVSSK